MEALTTPELVQAAVKAAFGVAPEQAEVDVGGSADSVDSTVATTSEGAIDTEVAVVEATPVGAAVTAEADALAGATLEVAAESGEANKEPVAAETLFRGRAS